MVLYRNIPSITASSSTMTSRLPRAHRRVMPLRSPAPGLARLRGFRRLFLFTSVIGGSLFPAVAVAPHRQNVGRVGGLVLDLHPQAADVDVHDLDVPEIIFAPDPFQDLFPAEGGAGAVEKQLHDLELHLGQLDGPAGLEQQPAVLVQDKLPADQGGGGVVPSGAARPT